MRRRALLGLPAVSSHVLPVDVSYDGASRQVQDAAAERLFMLFNTERTACKKTT